MSGAQKVEMGTAPIAANGRVDRNVRRLRCTTKKDENGTSKTAGNVLAAKSGR